MTAGVAGESHSVYVRTRVAGSEGANHLSEFPGCDSLCRLGGHIAAVSEPLTVLNPGVFGHGDGTGTLAGGVRFVQKNRTIPPVDRGLADMNMRLGHRAFQAEVDQGKVQLGPGIEGTMLHSADAMPRAGVVANPHTTGFEGEARWERLEVRAAKWLLDLPADLAARVRGRVHVDVGVAPSQRAHHFRELACGDALGRDGNDIGCGHRSRK